MVKPDENFGFNGSAGDIQTIVHVLHNLDQVGLITQT